MAGLAFAAVLALLAVQTVRLEGLKLWPLSVEGWKPTAQRLTLDIAAIRREQGLAGETAKSERLQQEARYRGIAERIDDDAQERLAGAMDAADRFIAAGGVQPRTLGSSRGRAGTGCQDRGARNPQGTGPEAELDAAEIGGDFGVPEGLVIVPAEDVRICTTNTIKAEAGRELAIELERASRAD
jgi:hypothetical protein